MNALPSAELVVMIDANARIAPDGRTCGSCELDRDSINGTFLKEFLQPVKHYFCLKSPKRISIFQILERKSA